MFWKWRISFVISMQCFKKRILDYDWKSVFWKSTITLNFGHVCCPCCFSLSLSFHFILKKSVIIMKPWNILNTDLNHLIFYLRFFFHRLIYLMNQILYLSYLSPVDFTQIVLEYRSHSNGGLLKKGHNAYRAHKLLIWRSLYECLSL